MSLLKQAGWLMVGCVMLAVMVSVGAWCIHRVEGAAEVLEAKVSEIADAGGIGHGDRHAPLSAQIIGPGTVNSPGDDAVYHVVTPGRDPRDLLLTYGMEPRLNGETQLITDGLQPGYVRALTRPGRWRINVAAADPRTRESVMTSFRLTVPGSQYVQPKPTPDEDAAPDAPKPKPETDQKPDVKPAPDVKPTPAPDPPKPKPAPVPTRFSDLTSKVRSLLPDVKSPNKETERHAIAAGALAIAKRCQDGDLANEAPDKLKSKVIDAVRVANVSAVGSNALHWTQFGLQVHTWIGEQVTRKLIVTAADWSDALTAFAAGMQS